MGEFLWDAVIVVFGYGFGTVWLLMMLSAAVRSFLEGWRGE